MNFLRAGMSRLVPPPKGQKCETCRYFAETTAGGRDGVCLNRPYDVALQHKKGLAKNFRAYWKKDWCMLWDGKEKKKNKSQQGFGFEVEVDKTEVER
jgi:hypothetical protein